MTNDQTYPTQAELEMIAQLQDVNLGQTPCIILPDLFPLDFHAVAQEIRRVLESYNLFAPEDMRSHSIQEIDLENFIAEPELFLMERLMLLVAQAGNHDCMLPPLECERMIDEIRSIVENGGSAPYLSLGRDGEIRETEIDFLSIVRKIETVLVTNNLSDTISTGIPSLESFDSSPMSVVHICIQKHNRRIRQEAERRKLSASDTTQLRLPSLESVMAMRELQKKCKGKKRRQE